MNEMIDRVAKALCKQDSEPKECARFYAAIARVAIEAMREPTAAMLTAGWEAALFDHRAVDQAEYEAAAKEYPRSVWRRMIDAALTPPSQ